MKKLLLTCLVIFLAGCQSTAQNEQQVAMQKELDNLKVVQRQIAIKVGLGALVRPEKIELAKDGIWIGSQDAAVVMIEFTDLHCPYCKRYQSDVWPELKKKYVDTKKVAVLARELPIAELHPKSPYAAVMLRCADQQGHYEAMKDTLFTIGSDLVKSDIDRVIEEYQLDDEKYRECLTDTSVQSKVSESIKDANELGIASTPNFFIGRKVDNKLVDYQLIKGASSVEEFSKVIDGFLSAK